MPSRRSKTDITRGAAVRKTAPNTSTMAGAALVAPDKPLTEMQRTFVKFWAEGESITSAMQRAGYNEQPSYGYRMAKMPNVLAEYQRIKAKFEEAAQMSRKKVMDMLVESYDMAKLMAEPASMVSAAREIGKMCGYYEPVKTKIEMTVNGQVVHKHMESMSDEDLVKFIAEAMAQASQVPVMEALEDGEEP